MRFKRAVIAVVWGIAGFASAFALAQERDRPEPDIADAAYGDHERQVLDFWKAESKEPTPVVVYIHGGGFRGGDKSTLPTRLLNGCLEAGVSVAATHYRLSHDAPFPAPMHDGARAIQFLRSKAEAWNIDPNRIAATGGSAGAGISLWVAFHDDLADPESDDPIARESSRLTCAAVFGAQTSYDPRVIATIIGGRAAEHPALPPFYGLTEEDFGDPSEEAQARFEAASPDQYVTADDPPALLIYGAPKGPLPPDAAPGRGIHHLHFGYYLAARLDDDNIECLVRHLDELPKSEETGRPDPYVEVLAFFARHFELNAPIGEAAESNP